ncbi:conserved hypothetical protein [Alphaproteobacteria bacterium]
MLRLLPYLIIFMLILGFSKLMDVLDGEDSIGDVLKVLDLRAENPTDKPDVAQSQNQQQKSSVTGSVDVTSTNNTKQGVSKNEDDKVAQSIPNKSDSNSKSQEKIASGTSTSTLLNDSQAAFAELSSSEINILQSLRKRHLELEDLAEKLSVKESALGAVKQEIQDKITYLEKLQNKLADLMKKYDSKEENKVGRLVKIYENMKSKEAAKVFDKLQINVLVEVAESMKEGKLSAIIGEMMPEKAKELTVALANRSRQALEVDAQY